MLLLLLNPCSVLTSGFTLPPAGVTSKSEQRDWIPVWGPPVLPTQSQQGCRHGPGTFYHLLRKARAAEPKQCPLVP